MKICKGTTWSSVCTSAGILFLNWCDALVPCLIWQLCPLFSIDLLTALERRTDTSFLVTGNVPKHYKNQQNNLVVLRIASVCAKYSWFFSLCFWILCILELWKLGRGNWNHWHNVCRWASLCRKNWGYLSTKKFFACLSPLLPSPGTWLCIMFPQLNEREDKSLESECPEATQQTVIVVNNHLSLNI